MVVSNLGQLRDRGNVVFRVSNTVNPLDYMKDLSEYLPLYINRAGLVIDRRRE